MAASSPSEILRGSWQVFINFREVDLPNNFISHLEGALFLAGIKYFIDTKDVSSEDLSVHFSRIKQSKIALSIFSINYAKSAWCLDKLVEIMEQVEKGKLRIIPVFFNVEPDEVRGQKGVVSFRLYGDGRWKRPNISKWEKALESVPSMIGLNLKNYRNEWDFIESIVDSIKRMLALVPPPVNRGGEHLKDAEFFGSESRGGGHASGQNFPMASSSSSERLPESWQVFINCRGSVLLNHFISHLEGALDLARIEYNGDTREVRSEDVNVHFAWIRQSKIALSIFSSNYPESEWCLDELVEIMERVEKGKLMIIPIFFNVEPEEVRKLKGWFGLEQYKGGIRNQPNMLKWEKALQSVPSKMGLYLEDYRNEWELIESIVELIKIMLGLEYPEYLSKNRKEHPKYTKFPTGTSYGDINKSSAAFSNINQHRPQHPSLHFDSSDAEEIDAEFFASESRGGNASGNELDFLDSIIDSTEKELAVVPPPVNRGGEYLKDTEFPTGTSYNDINNSSAASSYFNQHKPQHPSLHFDSSDAEEIDAEFFGSESRGGSNASGNIPEKRTFTNSRMDGPVKPPQIQDSAELNFRGEELRYGFVSHLIMALKSHRIRSQLGMKIGCLLVLFFCLQQIAYRSTRLIDHGSAIDRIVEYIPTDGTRDKDTEFPTCKVGANPDSSSSDAKTIAADFFDRTCTNSPTNDKVKPPKIQVFINFRGAQLRNNFVGYLVDALRRSEINVFIDKQAKIGEDLNTLFKRIEDSGIAIVVFSSRYTESKWCLEELVKIKERVDLELLKVLPIFYKVTPTNVKRLKGEFGDNFRDKEYLYASDEAKIKRWKEAIASVSRKFALTLDEKSSILEIDFVETVVKEVLKMLQAMSKVESGQCSC